MRKRWGYVLGIMGMGLLAVVAKYSHRHRERSYQEHLLLGAAGLLRGYKNRNPDEALQDALMIIDIVERHLDPEVRNGNLGVRLRTILEECKRVKSDVGEFLLYSRYHGALESLAEKIDSLV